VVADHFLAVRFGDLWKTVDERLHKLAAAESMVIEGPEILSGTHIVRGTGVPVHNVAALFDDGTPVKEILQAYPSMTESQVELASIYAKAVPQRVARSGCNCLPARRFSASPVPTATTSALPPLNTRTFPQGCHVQIAPA
jgi:uncharacterized protein (DUF433 family)